MTALVMVGQRWVAAQLARPWQESATHTLQWTVVSVFFLYFYLLFLKIFGYCVLGTFKVG